jgi:hypothetical protein
LLKNWYNGEHSPGQQINKFGSFRLASTAGTITGDHEDGSGCLTMLEVDFGLRVSGLCRDGTHPTTDSSSIAGMEYFLPQQRLCGTPYLLAQRPPVNQNFRFIRRRAQLTPSIQNHEPVLLTVSSSIKQRGSKVVEISSQLWKPSYFLLVVDVHFAQIGVFGAQVEGIMVPRKVDRMSHR